MSQWPVEQLSLKRVELRVCGPSGLCGSTISKPRPHQTTSDHTEPSYLRPAQFSSSVHERFWTRTGFCSPTPTVRSSCLTDPVFNPAVRKREKEAVQVIWDTPESASVCQRSRNRTEGVDLTPDTRPEEDTNPPPPHFSAVTLPPAGLDWLSSQVIEHHLRASVRFSILGWGL